MGICMERQLIPKSIPVEDTNLYHTRYLHKDFSRLKTEWNRNAIQTDLDITCVFHGQDCLLLYLRHCLTFIPPCGIYNLHLKPILSRKYSINPFWLIPTSYHRFYISYLPQFSDMICSGQYWLETKNQGSATCSHVHLVWRRLLEITTWNMQTR